MSSLGKNKRNGDESKSKRRKSAPVLKRQSSNIDENELDTIKLDYKKGKENSAFEDEEKHHHVDSSQYNKTLGKDKEVSDDEVPLTAVHEGGSGKGVEAGTQPNGDADENIDQTLEDLKGGKRYWRVSWHTAISGISKVLKYITTHLPTKFNHPEKTMEDCDILSFLCSVLQVHLEFWNSTDPFTEYGPDFTKSSDLIQQECEHMICETVSLLKHIRSCQYLPNLNTVKTMDKLQKLNGDLIFILDEYFYMNIWKPID